jgi:site-specific DNA recombinase
MKIWNVALYTRVSSDKKNQQESIPAQVQSLKKWLSEKSKDDTDSVYKLVEVYEDQGFSGSNSDRDSFMRMIEDIDAGKINMVITRDLSRFSRNYLEAGYYIEDYFMDKSVRLVCTLDNVDTLEEVSDIVPFKNILNEMFIKDCSRKIKDSLKQRMLRGSSIASRPPYGYRFESNYDGNNKIIKLVPENDETTEVVREIYTLFLKGWGYGKIATHLNRKKILPPSKRLGIYSNAKFGIWNNGTIKSILTNPKYGGMMVQQRWKKISFKKKVVRETSKDEWIHGKDFDGIIGKDIFEEVQQIMKKRSENYRYKGETKHPYSTVLKCNECGGSMSYRKKYEGYKCTNSQRGGGRCSTHSVKEEFLSQIIVHDLEKYVEQYINKERICKTLAEQKEKKSNKHNELDSTIRELDKLDKEFQRVYQDKLDELITERNFQNLVSSIQRRQESLVQRKEELEKLNKRLGGSNTIYDLYKDLIDKLIHFQLFQRDIVEKLIDKIIVTEDVASKSKKIDIYYKFKDSISEMTNNV